MIRYLTRRQRYLLLVWFILIAYGLDFELSAFYTLEAPAADYLIILASVLVLGIYVVPAILGLRKATFLFKLDGEIILMSLITGLFITGWLASYGNEIVGYVWKEILPKKTYQDWEAALTAPVVEEFLKTFFAFFVLYFFKKWNKKLVFFTGLTTGLGFQIIEDFAYVVSESTVDINTSLSTALYRVTGLLGSHYLYSAILTLGIYLLFSKAKDLPKWKVYLWAIGPIVAHFIWNSPLNTAGFISAILTGLSLWVLADVIGYVFDLESSFIKKD